MRHYLLPCLMLLAALLPAHAHAGCACPTGENGIEAAYDAADLVFTGEATKLTMGFYHYEVHATTFTPIEIFKGVGNVQEIAIATLQDGTDCDLTFWEKRKYLVYAKLYEGQLFRASICSRTTFMDGAEEEIATIRTLEYNPLRQMPDTIDGVEMPPAGWQDKLPTQQP